MNKLSWSGLQQFKESSPEEFLVNGVGQGYVKKFSNLLYYFIKNAGHMVPADAPDAALQMFREIVS